MVQVSDYKLTHPDQEEILDKLINGLNANGSTLHQRIFAVSGDRGWGKSTILHIAREILERNNNNPTTTNSSVSIFVTPIIDASIISEEVGIFGTVIHLIHETCQVHFSANDRNNLNKRYEALSTDIIRQQTAYKNIAKEMAMSTDHYVQIMLEWHRQSQKVSKTFEEYTSDLVKVLGRNCKIPKFVIFLDDLDLADHETLRVWVKNLLGWFKESSFQTHWVLSFEKQRLLRALSPMKPDKSPDLDIGRSWLTKLVATQRQYSLLPWTQLEREQFKSYNDGLDWRNIKLDENTELKKCDPLLDLLKKKGLSNFVTALPGFPRALNSLSHWLQRPMDHELPPQIKHSFLEKIADTQGVLPDFKELAQSSPFSRLDFPTAYVNWKDDILAPILNNESLVLDQTKGGFVNAALYIEQLCDIALYSHFDLRRLLSITNQLAFFKNANASFSFSNAQVITRHFRESNPRMGASLIWSDWKPEKSGVGFSLHTGPRIFWESLFLNDKHQVHHMLSFYQLNSATLGLKIDKQFEAARMRTHNSAALGLKIEKKLKAARKLQPNSALALKIDKKFRAARKLQLNSATLNSKNDEQLKEARTQLDFMPRNLRGLLLLIDKLAGAPWLELSLSYKFWSPLTVVICSAAFYLSAMAETIWPEMASENPLYWPRNSYANVKLLDNQQVSKSFTELLEELNNRHYPDGDASPLDLARRELYRAFGNLLQLGAVRQLVTA